MQISPAKSPRTLSIGGATYDIFVHMDDTTERAIRSEQALSLPVGGKIQVKSVREGCGGGASNTSVGLARLGCKAGFCGIVGSDQWGQILLNNLKREGVDTTSATVVEAETSSFSLVLLLSGGERTILYSSGVSEHLHEVTFEREALTHVDAVYLNHLCETSCMIEDDIIVMLSKKDGIHLTWNPGGCQIEAGMTSKDKAALLKKTTLLQLNKEEAFTFTGRKTIEDALKILNAAGAKYVCVTDGQHGSYASDGNRYYHCPIREDAKRISTTGAGDAFGVGMSWALLTGISLPEALVAGTMNAASVIGVIGAQPGLLTLHQMQELLRKKLIEPTILAW